MATLNEQIKKNLIAKEKIEKDADFPQKMRDVKPSVLASLFEVMGGGCVSCGKRVSYLNLEFYDFDVIRVRCYACQEMTRTEDDERFPDEEEYTDSLKAQIEDYYTAHSL